MNTGTDSGIVVINYLKVFFRRKEYIIIATFIGLIIGICASIMLPKKYQSTTVLLVEEGKSDNPFFSNIAVSSTVQQRLTTIREAMLGWNNLVSLVKRMNLDKDAKTSKEFEDLILKIRKNIVFKMRNQNVIELGYVDKDPIQTQAVLKNLTEIFIERNVEVQNLETSDAITFIEEQLKVYKGKIKSSEIAKLEDQLTSLLADSTEKHPLVKQLRDQIEKKKEELKKENLEYTRSDVIKNESSNPIITEIQKALDNLESSKKVVGSPTTEADLAKVMLIDKLGSALKEEDVLARDVVVNENIYNMLLQRLETAKITQRLQSSKEGTKYTVLDPPRIPFQPFEPNKPLVIFLGLFFGLCVGFGAVFFLEFLDKSFIDVEDAKDFLGVPLFGAISKITTTDTIKLEQERERWMYSLTFIGGVVVVVVTIAVSNFIK